VRFFLIQSRTITDEPTQQSINPVMLQRIQYKPAERESVEKRRTTQAHTRIHAGGHNDRCGTIDCMHIHTGRSDAVRGREGWNYRSDERRHHRSRAGPKNKRSVRGTAIRGGERRRGTKSSVTIDLTTSNHTQCNERMK